MNQVCSYPKRYDVQECSLRVVYLINLKFKDRYFIDTSADIHIYVYLYVFCDMLKLCSTAAPDCRTGQNKGRYREQERSFLLVSLCILLRLLLQILYASIVHWGNKGHASVALLPVLSIVSKAIKLHQFIQMLVILYQLRSFKQYLGRF